MNTNNTISNPELPGTQRPTSRYYSQLIQYLNGPRERIFNLVDPLKRSRSTTPAKDITLLPPELVTIFSLNNDNMYAVRQFMRDLPYKDRIDLLHLYITEEIDIESSPFLSLFGNSFTHEEIDDFLALHVKLVNSASGAIQDPDNSERLSSLKMLLDDYVNAEFYCRYPDILNKWQKKAGMSSKKAKNVADISSIMNFIEEYVHFLDIFCKGKLVSESMEYFYKKEDTFTYFIRNLVERMPLYMQRFFPPSLVNIDNLPRLERSIREKMHMFKSNEVFVSFAAEIILQAMMHLRLQEEEFELLLQISNFTPNPITNDEKYRSIFFLENSETHPLALLQQWCLKRIDTKDFLTCIKECSPENIADVQYDSTDDDPTDDDPTDDDSIDDDSIVDDAIEGNIYRTIGFNSYDLEEIQRRRIENFLVLDSFMYYLIKSIPDNPEEDLAEVDRDLLEKFIDVLDRRFGRDFPVILQRALRGVQERFPFMGANILSPE